MDCKLVFVGQVMGGAEAVNQRTGQYLFNKLPNEAANVVAGTSFDPFQRELSEYEIQAWVEEHLIFDECEVVGVFRDNTILWVKEE